MNHMPQFVFNGASYMLAAVWTGEFLAKTHPAGSFKVALENLSRSYKKSFIDDGFDQEWARIVPTISGVTIIAEPHARLHFFRLLHYVVEQYSPDGRRRSNLLYRLGSKRSDETNVKSEKRENDALIHMMMYYGHMQTGKIDTRTFQTKLTSYN